MPPVSNLKGKFIVFEGIDGCGKGTQLKLAASYLFDKDKDYDIYKTREPTRNFKEIREKLEQGKDVSQDGEWYAQMFVTDRKHHVENHIQPALNQGTHVLCDRFKHSTLAYQNAQGLPFSRLIEMHQGILVPDLTLIFDCPAKIAFERRKIGGATEVFDKDLEFQEKLRQNYLKLKEELKDENIVIINATKSKQEVFEQVKKVLDSLF